MQHLPEVSLSQVSSIKSLCHDYDNYYYVLSVAVQKCFHKKSLHVSVHIIQKIDYTTHLSSSDV